MLRLRKTASASWRLSVPWCVTLARPETKTCINGLHATFSTFAFIKGPVSIVDCEISLSEFHSALHCQDMYFMWQNPHLPQLQSQKQQPDAKRQKPTMGQQQQAGRQPLALRAPLQQLNGSQPPPRQQALGGGLSQQIQPAKGGGAPSQAAASVPAGPSAPRPHALAAPSQPPAVTAGQAAPTPQQVSAAAAQLQAAAAGVLPQQAATPAGPAADTQPAATPVVDAAPAAAGKKVRHCVRFPPVQLGLDVVVFLVCIRSHHALTAIEDTCLWVHDDCCQHLGINAI